MSLAGHDLANCSSRIFEIFYHNRGNLSKRNYDVIFESEFERTCVEINRNMDYANALLMSVQLELYYNVVDFQHVLNIEDQFDWSIHWLRRCGHGIHTLIKIFDNV